LDRQAPHDMADATRRKLSAEDAGGPSRKRSTAVEDLGPGGTDARTDMPALGGAACEGKPHFQSEVQHQAVSAAERVAETA